MTRQSRKAGTQRTTTVPTDEPVFVISVAADLVGVHPQTLRSYERAGLITPHRTSGGSRRYSYNNITRLERIRHLRGEGLNLSGVARVLELERRVEEATEPSTELVLYRSARHHRRQSHQKNRTNHGG